MDNIDWVRVKNKDSKEGDTTAGSDHLSEPEQIDTLATRKGGCLHLPVCQDPSRARICIPCLSACRNGSDYATW